MKYITIVASSYEQALLKAREEYGDKLRIHSRKDFLTKGFLGLNKKPKCELTCYLVDNEEDNKEDEVDKSLLKRFEDEAQTPNPDIEYEESNKTLIEDTEDKKDTSSLQIESVDSLLSRANKFLLLNEFADDIRKEILRNLQIQLEKAFPSVPTEKELEMLVVDNIIDLVEIDHNSQLNPPKVFVVLGPTGIGKTTTIAKIAALYGTVPPEDIRKDVNIISLDSYRVGAFEQMEAFGKALGIAVYRAENPEEFVSKIDELSDLDILLIDTIGKSPKDADLGRRLDSFLSELNPDDTKFYLALSSTMKESDMERAYEQFSPYGISSVIITKVDETVALGNILSLCRRKKLSLLFITDGQHVPQDINAASSAYILSMLKGFTIDLSSLRDLQ